MPDRDVKTIQDLIYYQYAALREKGEPGFDPINDIETTPWQAVES